MQLRDAGEYRFETRVDGFRILHPQRSPVGLTVRGGIFELSGGRRTELVPTTLHVRDLCHKLGAMLVGSEAGPLGRSVEPWLLDAWAIAAPVARERDRLLAHVPAELLAAQHATLAVCGKVPAMDCWAELGQMPYVLADIAHFRAAAIALVEADEQSVERGDDDGSGAIVRRMEQWRGVFAPDGVPYRALNRTLMQLAETVPVRLLPRLAQVRLERAITDPIELTTLLVHIGIGRQRLESPVLVSRDRIFQHARLDEIALALRLVGGAMRRTLRPAALPDLEIAVGYIDDFPEEYSGRLPSLARRAIRWHRAARYRVDREKVVRMGGREKLTARPPIALPEDERIRFLDTVGAVVDEGVDMEHCIGGYAGGAVAGYSYLFHVDYEGQRASFEVGPDGRIRQAFGPRNSENDAVRWGHDRLFEWAAPMRPVEPEPASVPEAPRDRLPLRDFCPREPPRPRRRRVRRHQVDPRQMSFGFAP